MTMNEKKNNRFMPLLMAVSVVVGILIGTFYANHFSGNRLSIINSGSNKLNNLLRLVDDQYVDTVNVNDLVEKAMPQIPWNSTRTLSISPPRTCRLPTTT